jgi:selenide,water dikinase
MAEASGASLVIDAAALPLLPGAAMLAAGNVSGGARTNRDHFGGRVAIDPGVDEALRLIAFDPQTSGGLLLAVAPASLAILLDRLNAAEPGRPAGIAARHIGHITPREADATLVRIR